MENSSKTLTAAYLSTAEQRAREFKTEFDTLFTAYQNQIQSGASAQAAVGAIDNLLTRWRSFTNELRQVSETSSADGGAFDEASRVAAQLAELKQIAASYQSEAGTRIKQGDSLNPKSVPSPYTNILGLQRTFRASTRTGILIAAVIFSVLALGVLGFLVYKTVITGEIVAPAYVASQQGGRRRG